MDSPIVSVKNQFNGINPILNDILQVSTKWSWEDFHRYHLVHLSDQLFVMLQESPYMVQIEQSLQIRSPDNPSYIAAPEADVTMPKRSYRFPAKFQLKDYFVEVPTRNLIADIRYPIALGIFPFREKDGVQPLAWIELLTPNNKPGGSHATQYLAKRQQLLNTKELCFIELDYLNQTPPTILQHFPDYTKQQVGSTPYRILITDTRGLRVSYPPKTFDESESYVAGFGVDQHIPMIPLALPELEPILINLQSAYNTTFERVHYGKRKRIPIDYRDQPERFNAYSPEDQQRMLRRLITVRLAHQNGVSLDELSAPLPIDPDKVQPYLDELLS